MNPISWDCPGIVFRNALDPLSASEGERKGRWPAPVKVSRVGRWGSTYTYELTVQEAHEIWTHLMTLANCWQPVSVDAETVRVGR